MTEALPPLPRLLRERYRLDARIGEGGMGVVYRGVDLALERDVAVKLTRAEPTPEPATAARFLREVKSAAKIRHEHVVEVFDVGEDESGELFYVMELLVGESLGNRLKREGRLSPAAAVHVGAQVCEALDAAHRGGVIHRDLKPGNVMLLRRGHDDAFVKLIDFGISKSADAHTFPTRTGEIVGTIGYMAPEQIKGEDTSAQTDLYALGVMLYRTLTGTDVFEDRGLPAAVHDHLETAPMRLRQRAPEANIPAALEAAVLRCLAKRPADRFASASAAAEALLRSVEATEATESAATSPFELMVDNGPVPPDARSDTPPPSARDADAALQFELADLPRAATSLAPLGPRLCAQCGAANQRYARACGGCGDDLDSPEQRELRAHAPLALASTLVPLVPEQRASFLALPAPAKLKLALHATVALLLVNAWAFGFGVISTTLLVGSALVWINVFLGPTSRYRR
jgi:serine/threonine-protein kinase